MKKGIEVDSFDSNGIQATFLPNLTEITANSKKFYHCGTCEAIFPIRLSGSQFQPIDDTSTSTSKEITAAKKILSHNATLPDHNRSEAFGHIIHRNAYHQLVIFKYDDGSAHIISQPLIKVQEGGGGSISRKDNAPTRIRHLKDLNAPKE